jgi:hypothetical protein
MRREVSMLLVIAATAALAVPCSDPLADDDADGLPNGDEATIGTDCLDPDTDDDGLSDGIEVNGQNDASGVFDFAAAGASPLHRDVFLEVDAEVTAAGVDLMPSAAVEDALVDLYGSQPIPNPDGTSGIRVWLMRSDALAAGTDCASMYRGGAFDTYPSDTFFHASLCEGNPHGVSAGRNLFVDAAAPNATVADDATELVQHTWFRILAHELGHCLGLRHGGTDDLNFKPDYPSLMSYTHTGTLYGAAKTLAATDINFSEGAGAAYPIDECALVEYDAFAGSVVDYDFINFSDYGNGSHAFPAADLNPGHWEVDWDKNFATEIATYRGDVNGDCYVADVLYDSDDDATMASWEAAKLPADPEQRHLPAATTPGHPSLKDKGTGMCTQIVVDCPFKILTIAGMVPPGGFLDGHDHWHTTNDAGDPPSWCGSE